MTTAPSRSSTQLPDPAVRRFYRGSTDTRVIRADEVTADIGGVLSLPIGIQSQGDENGIQCTLTLDPTTFLAPRAFLGADAQGGTLNLDLSQAVASGRIGLTVVLPGGRRSLAGQREIAVIKADVPPSALPGESKPAGFVSVPIPPFATAPGGALIAAQTGTGSIMLVQVIPETSLQAQGDGSFRSERTPCAGGNMSYRDLTTS